MSTKRNKKYQQPSRTNPVVIAKKLDKITAELDHHKNLIHAINKANDRHVEHLSNFVRHDMKNAIQSLDGIVYNARKEGKVPDEMISQLKTAVDLLNGSLDNFSRIIPSSNNQSTTLPDILNAVDMLSRGNLQQKRVACTFDYDRGSTIVIHQPLQTLVQVIHNLVINAVNSLQDDSDRNILVKGIVDSDKCEIRVYDNGIPVPECNREIIFTYGFSTTNGTGIGLFHAKSVLNEMGGDVLLEDSDMENYTKCFSLKFNVNN